MDPFKRRTPLWVHVVTLAAFVFIMGTLSKFPELPGPIALWWAGAIAAGCGIQFLLERWDKRNYRGPQADETGKDGESERE